MKSSSLRNYCIITAVVLAACSDSTGPKQSVPGAYTLQTMNSQQLPFNIAEVFGVFKIEVMSGTMALNADFTFLERDILRTTLQTDATHSTVTIDTSNIAGHWELQDSVITLTDNTPTHDVLFGIASNGRLTLTFTQDGQAFTMRYTRN